MDSLSPSLPYPRREGWGHRFRMPTDRHRRLYDALLPQINLPSGPLTDLESLFVHRPQSLWLEIGFGNGEHLARCAQKNANIGYIGCEIFPRGLIHMLGRVEIFGLNNVRLTSEPAEKLLERLPAACLEGIFILYPDPWPKTRHYKRRLISRACIEQLARVLIPGGCIRFATDHDDYGAWALARFLERPDLFTWAGYMPEHWLKPWTDWESTAYERKALQRNVNPLYLTFTRLRI